MCVAGMHVAAMISNAMQSVEIIAAGWGYYLFKGGSLKSRLVMNAAGAGLYLQLTHLW